MIISWSTDQTLNEGLYSIVPLIPGSHLLTTLYQVTHGTKLVVPHSLRWEQGTKRTAVSELRNKISTSFSFPVITFKNLQGYLKNNRILISRIAIHEI